jgi:flagellar motor switch protein FliN/FliY
MASDPNNPQTPESDATGPIDPTAGRDPDSLAEDALRAAEEALESLGDLKSDMVTPPASFSGGQAESATPFSLPSFDGARAAVMPAAIDLLSDVNLNVKIELGRTRMLVEDVLKLAEGAVVELDKLAGDPVDVYVNDRHVARGEVLVLNDNFCVRINEIIGPAALRAVSV